MFMDAPDTLMYVAIGAFVLGWVVAKVSAALAGKIQATKRDPRDDRIRNLDAELRIAQSEAAKAKDTVDRQDETLTETQQFVADRDMVIASQKEKIAQLRADLKESVKKTRELRHELSNRAEENVRSEVKLREVETELSVAQASTDLIATGVLDYSVAPGNEDESEDPKPAKAAT
ncbi:MAG: Atg14 domain-containing protein [Gammaproteobacteria bacterium]|nr:Atg14 domain-containing protein [Gammaproteobacteria bacterium]